VLACTIVALLAACGGGGRSLPAVEDGPAKPVQVLFAQGDRAPVVVNDPTDTSRYPVDAGFVATFALGRQAITWDQRGLGIVNDSWRAPAGTSAIKTVNYAWMAGTTIRPWADGGNAQVCTSFTASVPQSSIKQGALGNYTGADLWFFDASTGKPTSGKGLIVSGFYFVDQSGDGPLQNYGPADYLAPLRSVQWGSPLGNSHWLTTTSGAMSRSTWAEPRRFGYCVNRDQVLFLLAASVDMLGGMADIHDMVLHQALLSSETALGVPSSQDPAAVGASLTSYFSDWTVFIQGAQ